MEVGFRYFADRNPDAIAVVEPDGTARSRGELDQRINRLARALVHAGLEQGDAMAIVAPNCGDYLVAYFAGLRAGLSVVPVNWHLSDDEIAFLLKDSGARAVVAHAELGSRMLDTICHNGERAVLFVAIGDAPGYTSLESIMSACAGAPPPFTASGRMMAYTSATTGRPRAVVLPAGNARAALDRIVRSNASFGIFPEDGNVHLCASMLYHSAPLAGAESSLEMGHRVVLSSRWEPELLLRLIDSHRVTTTFMVPTMFVRLLKLPRETRERYSTASLKFVIHGAAPCPPGIKRRMLEWWGNVIWESYGATEVQGTIASAEEWLKRPGTVGKPLPGSAVRILDEDRRELPPGETGLIYLLPHTGDAFEYKGDPAKTRLGYCGDFITVGDLGYLDAEGYLFLRDRAADLIISSGMNIYPAEIESVLIQHPAVSDCAVLAEAHELLGEVPKAFVQVAPEAEAGQALTADILQYLGTRLSAMKLPKRIEYVVRIPRDPSGKLFKRRLRARATAASSKAAARA